MQREMQQVGAGAGMEMNGVAESYRERFRPLTEGEVFDIAQACHEANRLYRAKLGEEMGPAWGKVDNETRASVMEGVQTYLGESGKLSSLKLRLDEESHNRWMERKLRLGWTWGANEDPVRKTHPCLLPYRSLPPEQRRKDVLFAAICSALDPRREV